MIEVLAAVAGASISVAAMGAFGIGKRNDEARDAVIRLTSAVEHIATQLEAMHLDIKETQSADMRRFEICVALRGEMTCKTHPPLYYSQGKPQQHVTRHTRPRSRS